MSFSQAAGTGIVPTLSRIVLAVVFVSLGYNKLFQNDSYTAAEATTLQQLGVSGITMLEEADAQPVAWLVPQDEPAPTEANPPLPAGLLPQSDPADPKTDPKTDPQTADPQTGPDTPAQDDPAPAPAPDSAPDSASDPAGDPASQTDDPAGTAADTDAGEPVIVDPDTTGTDVTADPRSHRRRRDRS